MLLTLSNSTVSVQEIIYQVDPLSLVSTTINSAGHTVPQFPVCSVELCRLPLPRTMVKVCLFSFLSSLNFLFQAPVKFEYKVDASDEVGILVLLVMILITLFTGSS